MNGIQDQVHASSITSATAPLRQAPDEIIVEGQQSQRKFSSLTMEFERYDRMKDIFDDVLWAFDWKVKTGGDFKALFEALAKHNEDRKKRKDRNKGKEGFDPAYA